MLHQSIENSDRKVMIFRKKNLIKNGYEYYLMYCTKLPYVNDWGVNESYVQKEDVLSFKKALSIANELVFNNATPQP